MSPPRRPLRALARVSLGLVLGLGLAEAAFWARDGGGFPHLQCLVADDATAVALRPGASGAIALGDNPVAPYTIDDQGWRTSPGGVPAGPEGVVVVGDSQVFGLGVADDETLPAALARATGRPVRNGGVPTWGPEEYLVALDRLLAETGAGTGVLVFNFGNDLFELGAPNHARHGVLDGWAVRIEAMPEAVTAFPGRRWLLADSHLVYAARQWLHAGEAAPAALPSEGDWDTVLAEVLRDREPAATQEAIAFEEQLEQALEGQRDAARERRDIYGQLARRVTDDPEDELAFRARLEGLAVGDVVEDRYAEASRPIPVTAELLRRGARIERQVTAAIEDYLAEHPDHPTARALAEGEARTEQAQAQVDALVQQVVADLEAASPYTRLLDRAEEIAARHGAELVVVALPLDVQVDPERFRQYGAPPEDMSETLPLLDRLVGEARSRGLRAVSLVEPLRAAGPEAFLQGDLHLTARGHAAAAAALAATLEAPPPPPAPALSLADGRTLVPRPLEWAEWDENLVRGSSRNHCKTMRLREWQRVHCVTPEGGAPPIGAVAPDVPEAMIAAAPGRVDLLIPVVAGRDAEAWVAWADRVERLVVPGDGSPPAFSPAEALPPTPLPAQQPEALAALAAALDGVSPAGFYGRAEPGCGVWSDLLDRRACAKGSWLRPPVCATGTTRAGSTGHCFEACDAEHPCAAGTCTPHSGGSVCL